MFDSQLGEESPVDFDQVWQLQWIADPQIDGASVMQVFEAGGIEVHDSLAPLNLKFWNYSHASISEGWLSSCRYGSECRISMLINLMSITHGFIQIDLNGFNMIHIDSFGRSGEGRLLKCKKDLLKITK